MKGQSLIEICVALGLALIILTVATVSITKALSAASEGKKRTQASDLATQGLEIVRQLRDSDWDTFNSLSGQYCLAQECATISGASSTCGRNPGVCSRNAGIFTREVSIEKNSASCAVDVNTRRGTVQIRNTRVRVNVLWADSSCSNNSLCRNVSVESCMINKYADPNL